MPSGLILTPDCGQWITHGAWRRLPLSTSHPVCVFTPTGPGPAGPPFATAPLRRQSRLARRIACATCPGSVACRRLFRRDLARLCAGAMLLTIVPTDDYPDGLSTVSWKTLKHRYLTGNPFSQPPRAIHPRKYHETRHLPPKAGRIAAPAIISGGIDRKN